MRLIEKQFGMNPDTFAPELILTVALSLEPLQDATVNLSQEEVATILGLELLNMLQPKS